jgi:hypothetical protein
MTLRKRTERIDLGKGRSGAVSGPPLRALRRVIA